MPIILKSRRDIEMMRRAGQLGCQILAKMAEQARSGVSTGELNAIARDELQKQGGIGLSKGYTHAGTYKPEAPDAYPAETCISINEVVVHGIPGPRRLQEGDIVTLDLALSVNGYCSDTATTVGVGKVAPRVQKLLDVTM